MFSRQCFKITSSTRTWLFQSLTYTKSNNIIQCCCRLVNDNLQIPRLRSISSNTIGSKISIDSDVKTEATRSEEFKKHTAYQPTSQEELLEKFIAGLSSDIHQKNRVYKNDVLKIIDKVRELNFSTMHQSLLLIQCCTELLPDETPTSRMNLVEQIWNTLASHTKFSTEHYNRLLEVYIANNRTVKVDTFIQQMNPAKPDITTYELILQVLAEAGDLNQATEVLSNMKSQGIPATESIFNSLILCQGKCGNPQNINEVLTLMKSLKLDKSIDTYTAVVKALVWSKKSELVIEEMENAQKNYLGFTEIHIMDIVKTLAAVNNYAMIPEVLRFLPEKILKTPSISSYMQSVTTQLVFLNHPMAALAIYKCLPLPSFGPNDDQGLHGRSLVRECVRASISSSIITLITQELMSSGRNPIALQNACEAALRFGKIPLALDLFTNLKQIGLPLRPHYFWPILLHSSKSYGEKGIMNTISKMSVMEVLPDYNTIMNYCLPYVSFTSPQNLMKKFLENGLTVTTVLTPMMETLLSMGQVRAASELCEVFHGKIDGECLLKPLIKGYMISLDLKSTLNVLEDMCEKSSTQGKDWVGRFLCEFTNSKKFKEDASDFSVFLKALKNTNLKISTTSADYCISRLPDKLKPAALLQLKNNLIAVIDERLVDDADMLQQIPHPKKMNEDALRAHLIELEAKGMNTRGVLRKLLQLYCREGNLTEAREILGKCQREGIFLSAGMKASIFDLYVKLGELELADESLADLNKSSPNFTLDEFKIIDFATLMVYRKKLESAINLIVEQSKNRHIIGGRNIETNCWRLLDAMATNGTSQNVYECFHTLTTYGYCKPTNIVLGPLVRVHLKSDNIEEAVNEYVELANKYEKTPLKHELLCKILVDMADGQTEENFIFNEKANTKLNKLAQIVLNIDRQIHGPGDVQLTLLAALADVGYKKSFRRLILDPSIKVHPGALLRRCERFASEKKINALETIAECTSDHRQIDVESIYELILDVYQRDDNTQEALNLWYKMQETDVRPSEKFIKNIISLLKANNENIPPELATLFNSQTRNKLVVNKLVTKS